MEQSTVLPPAYTEAYALAWNGIMELNLRGQFASLISVEFNFVRQVATAVVSTNGTRRTIEYTVGWDDNGVLIAPSVKRIK
jgi:hypothetical protein